MSCLLIAARSWSQPCQEGERLFGAGSRVTYLLGDARGFGCSAARERRDDAHDCAGAHPQQVVTGVGKAHQPRVRETVDELVGSGLGHAGVAVAGQNDSGEGQLTQALGELERAKGQIGVAAAL